MKKLAVLIILSALLTQCGPPRTGEEAFYGACGPGKLTVQPGNRSAALKWITPCPDSVKVAGYNIYLSETSLDKYRYKKLPSRYESYNSAPYPGDAEPENGFETMTITGTENGKTYYISVRTVYTDGALSPASNEVEIICRPEGEFDLTYRYTGHDDGFSFADDSAAASDGDKNDLYFYISDGMDFLASPHRLNGFIRHSGFYSLGKTSDIYQYPDLKLDIEPVDRVPVGVGESYLVKTADGNFAKIRIEGAQGEKRDRVLKIRYIYQTINGLMKF